jgi:hypothetical protein
VKVETGVAGFLHAQGVVDVFFPVDKKGNAIINCFQCKFLSSNERTCQLTKEPVAFPKQYVSAKCPLLDSILQELEGGKNENVQRNS